MPCGFGFSGFSLKPFSTQYSSQIQRSAGLVGNGEVWISGLRRNIHMEQATLISWPVVVRGGTDDILVLGNAKRNPADHDREMHKFHATNARFDTWGRRDVQELSCRRRCHPLISPQFELSETDISSPLINLEERSAPTPFMYMDITTLHRALQEGWPRPQNLLTTAGCRSRISADLKGTTTLMSI